MAQPIAKTSPELKARVRYDDDLYSWVNEQVELLRQRRFDEIDFANIAEELSDVGSQRYEQLESAFRVLIMHMLKWDQQPERQTRSWEGSIAEQRRRIDRLLRKNPGLKSRIDEAIDEAYPDARGWAEIETGAVRDAFPRQCPYDWSSIMEREFRLQGD